MAHLTDSEVTDLLAGRLEPALWPGVVRHLLEGCSVCRGKLDRFTKPEEEAPGMAGEVSAGTYDAYDQAIDRALAAIPRHQAKWGKEKERLSNLLSILQDASSPRSGALTFQQARRYHGWPLVEALLQFSFQARYRDPQEMRWLAFEARVAAESIAPESYDPEFISDLKARAWAELANAHRVNDELEQAESALAEAQRLRNQGTGDLFLLARVADVEASLRRGQRRITEACTLLDELHHLYLELGESHLAGRSLISRGICERTGGAPRDAVRSLQEGLALLDSERDPQLASVANQALLDAMVDCGEFRRAAELLLESGLRQAFASDPLNLLRLRWVEGKILAGLGKLSRAEEVFAAVRDEFRERGLEYDAALAGLDLAAVWLQQGLVPEVLSLSRSMLDTFRDLGIHREAVKALRFFHLACKENVVTARLAYGVRSFLVQLQNEPKLRFEPSLVG